MTQHSTLATVGQDGAHMPTGSRVNSVTLTGVGVVLKSSHRNQAGILHPHTWEITVWCYYEGQDAERLSNKLFGIVAPYQGTCLPDRIAWAEQMARWIAVEWGDRSVHRITISRPEERLYAEWRAA